MNDNKEFSFPLLLTQISMLTMFLVSAGITTNFIINNMFAGFSGFDLFVVSFRIITFLIFYAAGFYLLLKRTKIGLLLALIFFSFYLIRNLYGIYVDGLDETPVEMGGVFNITEPELEGAMFAQKYGTVFMSLIQVYFVAYFLLSKKIRRIFGFETK